MKGCSKDKKDGKECGKDGKDREHSIYYAEKPSNKLAGKSYFDDRYLLPQTSFSDLAQDNLVLGVV